MKTLIFTIALLFSQFNLAEGFAADFDYKVLKKPVKTEVDKGKVEVRELFWYYCPHCYDLEPAIIHWLENNKPDEAIYIAQPAVFSERWVSGAMFYYMLEELNLLDALHGSLFNAIHKHKIKFKNIEDFINWLEYNGVDRKKAEKAAKSFSLRVKLNKAKINSTKYEVNGVPAIIVNGKYMINLTIANSAERLFEIVNYLVRKEVESSK